MKKEKFSNLVFNSRANFPLFYPDKDFHAAMFAVEKPLDLGRYKNILERKSHSFRSAGKPIKQIDIAPLSWNFKRELFLSFSFPLVCLFLIFCYHFFECFSQIKNFKNCFKKCLKVAEKTRKLKLLRLLAINSVERAVFVVDLSALCTPLKIGRCLDSICEQKRRKK